MENPTTGTAGRPDKISAYATWEIDDQPDPVAYSKATGTDLLINSSGGNVFSFVALFEIAKSRRAGALIDGDAVGAASIFVALDDVAMKPGATLGFRECRATKTGTAGDLAGTSRLLERLNAAMATAVARRRGVKVDVVRQWMTEERCFTADEALKAGLIDEIMPGRDTEVETKGEDYAYALGDIEVPYYQLHDGRRLPGRIPDTFADLLADQPENGS